MKAPIPYPLLIMLLIILLGALGMLSMMTGPQATGIFDLLTLLQTDPQTAWLIMYEVRLPRTALAIMEGVTLGLAGATLQGFLRNPLADPGVVGVTSSASLFAVITFYAGFASYFNGLALPLASITGALLCVMLLHLLVGRGSLLTLILAGVAISAVAGALMQLAMNLSPSPFATQEIMFWLMGSVTDRNMDHLLLAGPFMVIGWLVLFSVARSLDVMALGEEAAASLGVNLVRVRTILVLGVAVSVGAGAAVTGGIGFIGLVIPHLLRPLVGHKPSYLLLASALGGGALLVAADIFVRMIAAGPELKLGVVTALIGAPFFLWLIFRARTELET